MIPNNNLSVLPWYTSIEQQNARKWWIYGKVYPLFTPAGYILPFQLMVPHISGGGMYPGQKLTPTLQQNGYYDSAAIFHNVSILVSDTYNVSGMDKVYLTNIPRNTSFDNAQMAVAMDSNDNPLGTLTIPETGGYTGVWMLPTGAVKIVVLTRNPAWSYDTNGYVSEVISGGAAISDFRIFTKDGQLVGDYTAAIQPYISIVQYATLGYDVVVFGGQLPVFPAMNNGQYYAKMIISGSVYYSEIFTIVNDIEPYLKLEWWDNEDFVMDAGRVVYKYANNTQYKNVLYLCADIAKPEYPFEEEGEIRDGYFFPIKQISKKRYHFSFIASEYLLDVMRFIRMADFVQVTKNGQTYSLDTFLITPEWEDNGDVASVDAEFDTATVAKKIGVGYIKAQRGDFNDDFNDDFNNQ